MQKADYIKIKDPSHQRETFAANPRLIVGVEESIVKAPLV
jgi:hypothetical protein